MRGWRKRNGAAMELTLHHAHAWDLTPQQAIQVQRELAGFVRVEPLARPPQTIAGLDMSVRAEAVQAAIVVLALPSLVVIDQAIWRGPVTWPYVPGLLSFREAPAVLHALKQLHAMPDVLMADAQGVAHPRRMGLAAHIGVLLDMPVLGVAKSRLTGVYVEPDDVAGAQSPLQDGDETIGAVLRTRVGVKPLFVSVGNRMTLAEAVALVFATRTRYRMPEPTRLAHHLSRDQS